MTEDLDEGPWALQTLGVGRTARRCRLRRARAGRAGGRRGRPGADRSGRRHVTWTEQQGPSLRTPRKLTSGRLRPRPARGRPRPCTTRCGRSAPASGPGRRSGGRGVQGLAHLAVRQPELDPVPAEAAGRRRAMPGRLRICGRAAVRRLCAQGVVEVLLRPAGRQEHDARGRPSCVATASVWASGCEPCARPAQESAPQDASEEAPCPSRFRLRGAPSASLDPVGRLLPPGRADRPWSWTPGCA